MNILFLSLLQINSLGQHSIYTDLLREFVKRGHFVRIVSPTAEQETADLPRDGYAILRVKTPQIAGWRRDFLRLLSDSAISGQYRSIGAMCDLTLFFIPPRPSRWLAWWIG